ncbi:hypothetical protein SK128_005695 [Halocaridina rubra]|uniref:CUB domain-containing protein n=1 Tax=Halocaridina rubra TaxID=373956 RepID=A0AAN8WZ73_HALRR
MRALVAILIVVSSGGTMSLGPKTRRLTTLSCGSHVMNKGQRVAIQSPNFPRAYRNDYRCQYEITCNAREDTYLEFICPVFQLENSRGCTADRLIVTYKKYRSLKCGTNSPHGTKTTDGWARLTFFTNSQRNAKGFRCYIWCREQPAVTTAAATTADASTTAATTDAATAADTSAATSAVADTTPAVTTDTTNAAAATTVAVPTEAATTTDAAATTTASATA